MIRSAREWEKFRNLPVSSHKAKDNQILHVALSRGPSLRGVNYSPWVELMPLVSQVLHGFI